MTEYQTAVLALTQQGNLIALFVGLTQSGLIAGGLWIMRRANDRRDDLHAETMQQQAVTLEVLRQQGEALHQQGEALHQQSEALRVLIERTAPPPASSP